MKGKNLQPNILPEIEPGVIRTFTGKMINVFDPDPELICIEDIAHALSNLCRFGGHTRRFYSVAEHSVEVAKEVTIYHQMAGLLHDASEAYLIDLPSPVKYFIQKYQEYEQNLMLTIAEKFGFQYPLSSEVTKADKEMLQVEWAELMDYDLAMNTYKPLNPEEAEYQFLNFFEIQMLNY